MTEQDDAPSTPEHPVTPDQPPAAPVERAPDDTDEGWSERPVGEDRDDDWYERERPPHW